MGLVFCDSMDLYSNNQVILRYDYREFVNSQFSVTSQSMQPGVANAWCLTVSGTTNAVNNRLAVDFASASGAVLGIGVNVVSIYAVSMPVLGFNGSNNSAVVTLNILGSNDSAASTHFALNVAVCGITGTSLATAFPLSEWHRLELAVSLGRSNTGIVRAYVSGEIVISETVTVCNQVTRGYFGNNNTLRFDDFYVLTSVASGPTSAIGSTFLVRTLLPSADATVSWGVTDGTAHYSALASYGRNGHDGNATYIHTSTLSASDLFNMQDYSLQSGWAASSTEYPVAVQAVAALRYVDVLASVRLRLVQASGGASALGSISAASALYMYHQFAMNSDPAGASWTLAVVSGLQVAVDYVSQN